MIWQPAFTALAAFAFLLAIGPTCNLVRYMREGLSPDGVIFQPVLKLASLEAFLMAVRALGVSDAFSVTGGLLVPFAASSVAFAVYVLCCPLAAAICPRAAIDADYDVLNPARARRRAKRLN